MCKAFAGAPFGYTRIERPVVRHKRIYAFAAERYADAATPISVRFWRSVMDRCTSKEIEYHPWKNLVRRA